MALNTLHYLNAAEILQNKLITDDKAKVKKAYYQI